MTITLTEEVIYKLVALPDFNFVNLHIGLELELEESDEQFDFEDAPTILECEYDKFSNYVYIDHGVKQKTLENGEVINKRVIHALPKNRGENNYIIDAALQGEEFATSEYLDNVLFTFSLIEFESTGVTRLEVCTDGGNNFDVEDGNYI